MNPKMAAAYCLAQFALHHPVMLSHPPPRLTQGAKKPEQKYFTQVTRNSMGFCSTKATEISLGIA